MIGGSTAEGKALPPHLQFQTKALSDMTQRLRNKMVEWLPNVGGKFGCDEENNWPVTIRMNKKGGIDYSKFKKYLFSSIIVIYPNVSSVNLK